MTPQEIIRTELESLKADIAAHHRELGQPATGEFEQSLEIIEERGRFIIKSAKYGQQLIKGRKPGTMPPVQAILEWIKVKGITAKDIKIESLAFLIARSIKEKGTKYYQTGGTDLLDAVITPSRIQRIIDDLKDFHITELKTLIKRTLKEAA